MDKNSKMITMDEMGKVTGITVAGVNFSTKEAFVEYREKHQFKMGDAVQALFKSYSDTKVVPAFICGINDNAVLGAYQVFQFLGRDIRQLRR